MVRRLILSFLLLLCASFLFADSAKGTFVLDGNLYTINSVLAKTAENPSDSTKKDVLVLLTDQPVKESDFDLMNLETLAEAGQLHGILVRFESARETTGLVVLGAIQRSGSFVCAFDSTAFEPSRVAGRVYMDRPDSTFGRKYTFDIEFDATVRELTPSALDEASAEPLPSDGGEPGQAYREYERAIQSTNPQALKKYLVPEQAQKLDDPQSKKLLGLMKMMRAKEIRVVSGLMYEDRATLTLEGKDPVSSATTSGIARMKKVDGKWLLERESWSSTMR